MIRIPISLLAIFALGIIQVSFLTTWLRPVSSLNLVLSVVIFLTVIMSYHQGLWWAFGSGLFLELYSGLAFGITILSLILVVILINILFNNFFTNRSLYSLIFLGLIATISYTFIIWGFNFLTLIFGSAEILINLNFWYHLFWQSILNLIILTIIFFTFYISTGRLKNIFLFPGH